MKTSTIKTLLTAALFLAGFGSAQAEDIDIFSGATANGATPNVLILVDNTSSNDAAYASSCPYTGAPANLPNGNLLDMVYCALYGTLETIKTPDPITGQTPLLGRLNVGLMVGGSGSNKGGEMSYPPSSPYNLPLMNASGIAAFETIISAGIPKATGNAKLDGDMTEVWAWLTGNTGPRSGTSYSAHIGTLSCQKSFLIIIGAAAKQGRPCNGSGCGSASELAGAGATAAQQVQINTSPLGTHTGDDGSWIDEWTRFLYQTDFNNNADDRQSVVTYTIAAGGDALDYTQLLASAAYQGGGKPFVGSDYNSMKQAFLQIFNEVAATNSVFASSSLPVAANAQGSFQNQIFIGMFRPQSEGNPRWMGNLKQYQFGVTGTPPNVQLFLADADGVDAISAAGSGFIIPTARSFWTSKDTSKLPDSIGGFWVNNPQGDGGGYDRKDGDIVEKGGVGQQLRLANLQDDYGANPATPRKVYTCNSASGLCGSGASLSATPFATTNANLTAAVLGISPPSYNVSTLSRSGTTVTVTLSSTPSPALTNGQSVTIQGAANAELNGNFTITLGSATTFTYTIVESPVTPSTGTYTASLPSNPKTITSLTRAGTTATATSNGHGYANGESITITGANGAPYNGTFVISGATANTFQYTIIDSPVPATTGGAADIGATHTNPITFTTAQITRDATHADNTSIVTVTSGSNLAAAYAAGAKVNVSGVTPSAYNVVLATITNIGNSCPSGSNKKSFCYSIVTTPATPDTGANKQADRTASVAISGLTHPVACTGGSPTPTTTVTATTSAAHPFVTGDVVSIAGSPVGANESAYVGSSTITKLSSTTFTYSATTSPPCAPSASGVTVATNTGGVDKDSLINWVRGEDDIGDEPSPGSGITIRPSVHGDVVHSRPAIINYPSIGVVVFYGSNDGVFRAINGNQTASIGSVVPGGELWSFIPVEFFTKLKRQYLNGPILKLANTPAGIIPTPQPKDYAFDGVSTTYHDASAGKYYLFLSARRGGRLLYALDVTDPTAPKFMWKRANTDSGFGELGYTWSTPNVTLVKGYAKPVLIFGAGYDPSEDSEPPGADSMGRGIFILDATDGSIVWQAKGGGASNSCSGNPCTLLDMTYAVPADVTLLDRIQPDGTKADGYVERLYAADTGGNIWRVDLEPAGGNTPSYWQVTKFAALGGSGATKRKFLYPPDIMATTHFDAILAGTGDREHPLYQNGSYSVVNRFYMIKDTNIGNDASGWSTVADNTISTADNAPSSLVHITLPAPPNPKYDGTLSGFYITLPNTGEKVVNAPTSIGGFTYFGTNQPTAPSNLSCTNGRGTARDYQVNFVTGETTSGTLDTGGLPPSPVAGLVNVTDSNGDTLLVPFLLGGNPSSTCVGPDCRSSLGGTRPPIPINATRRRLYWYLDKLDK